MLCKTVTLTNHPRIRRPRDMASTCNMWSWIRCWTRKNCYKRDHWWNFTVIHSLLCNIVPMLNFLTFIIMPWLWRWMSLLWGTMYWSIYQWKGKVSAAHYHSFKGKLYMWEKGKTIKQTCHILLTAESKWGYVGVFVIVVYSYKLSVSLKLVPN